jgi:TRAP-type C4-dicarboxylate transport system substrate-binding protein
MKEIEERTNGRVKITLFPSEALGSIMEHYQMALSGMADISHIDLGVTPGVFPLSEGISLPMIFDSSESAACTYMELVDKQLAATEYKDVKFLFPVVTPPSRVHMATKPVHTLEDFAGMKVSSTSEAGLKTLEKLGATPVPVPMTDVYTSMERGLVDGFIENNEALVAFKLMEVSKYRTDVALNTAACAVIMNLDVWNSLPADIQQIFDETAGLTMAHKWGQGFDGIIEQILADVVIPYDQEQGNPEFYTLPAEEEARWREAVAPLYDEWITDREAEGLPAQAFFDDILELAAKYNK